MGKMIELQFCLCRIVDISGLSFGFLSIADFSNHFPFLTSFNRFKFVICFTFNWLLRLEHQQDGLDSEDSYDWVSFKLMWSNCGLVLSIVVYWKWRFSYILYPKYSTYCGILNTVTFCILNISCSASNTLRVAIV